VRFGLRRGRDPEVGALVVAATAFAVVLPITVAAGQLSDLSDLELWPFFLIGLLVPGLSQVLFTQAVRGTGASRTAILIGTAPVISALLAVGLLGEPVRAGLVAGTVLVVAGGMALARERDRPEDWRALGAVLAIACAVLFGVRDNVVRWAAERDSNPPILAATTATLIAATLFALGWVLARRRRGLAAELRSSIPAFVPAGVALGLAYASIVVALDRGRVTVVAPLNATQSLWGIVLAALLVGRAEAIGRRTVLAGVLVVAGAVLIGASR
jgi:drug/metabolite transporter (DMT)-like permease